MPDQADPSLQASTPSHLQEVAQVAHDLKRLLAGAESARLKSEVRDQIDTLGQWTETYLAGLEAAQKITDNAGGTLAEARKELELAYQQYVRFEDEGGNPATPAQQRQTDELSKALRRIQTLIPAFSQAVADPSQPAPETTPPAQRPDVAPEVSPPLESPVTSPDVLPVLPPVMDPEM